MFVDHIRVYAKAGDGGAGCASFRREAFVPRGGPDGGDGGDGGDVVLRADPQTDSLVTFFFDPKLIAKDGQPGRRKKQFGKSIPPRIFPVPVGTMVFRLPPGASVPGQPSVNLPAAGATTNGDGDEPAPHVDPAAARPPMATDDLEPVIDLDKPGQDFVLCRAGKGGRGNVHFKSSTNQAPTRADAGTPGEEGRFYLELRTIADAGLVGFPNAGKSTLLGALSAARPKVAAYPFTTLHPMVGVVEFADSYERITVADIPGLIEGAHRNVGLGHEFLRHILRCRVLLFVLDMAGSETRDPLADFAGLRRELSLYHPELGERAALVVANKMDLPDAGENLRRFRERFPKFDAIPLSAASQDGMDGLRQALAARLLGDNSRGRIPAVTASE